MRATIRSWLRSPLFWWTLVGINVVYLAAQPLTVCFTVAFVAGLHTLILVPMRR